MDGVRGLPPQDDPEDYNLYGIDWEAIEDPRLRAHRQGTAEDEEEPGHPELANNVVCEPPNCPLTDEQVPRLWEELTAVVDVTLRGMGSRRALWVTALELLIQLVGEAE